MVLLGRYEEADKVNSQLTETFEMATPDAKTMFMVAMVNELYTGDPGLEIMKKLVEIRPKYDRGILAMRLLMKRRNLRLDFSGNSELAEAFNSDMKNDEFDALLKKCRAESPMSVTYLIRYIKNMEFNQA